MPAKNFGMRLSAHERREIERLARTLGKNMKDAVLDAVRQRLGELNDEESFSPRPGGPLEGLEDILGTFDSGLGDLSTNKEYLEGYGN